MRKAWVSQRKNRPGWYVGWYDSTGKQRAKRCPNKALANRYARNLEHKYNEDLFPDPVDMPWDRVVGEYLAYKEVVTRLVSESLRSIKGTLLRFKALHGPVASTRIDQRMINSYIAHRIKRSPATVNKDLRNLRAFVRWCKKNRYNGNRFDWEMQKEQKRPVRSLTKKQLENLLIAAKKYQRYGDAWYLRVMLAISSGIRQGDIEALGIRDIDFESASFCTRNQKTGASMPHRSLHPAAVTALINYVASLPDGQDALFTDRFTSGKWERIRNNAGLPEFHFHDLRKSFGSFVAQAGFATSVVQDLLEHSTEKLTKDVYLDIDPVRRKAVESVPITPL
jgi:integrase